MGKITLELNDEDLLKLGELKIKEEMGRTLKGLKMKGLLKSVSQALSTLEINYEDEVEKIKQESWSAYKKGLPL